MPVAFAAAHNTTPSVVFVRPIALFIIVASRSINSLIWALMLVTIVGPGVFAGILAIGFRSIGFCAKLLYEAIEEIDGLERQKERLLARMEIIEELQTTTTSERAGRTMDKETEDSFEKLRARGYM